MRGSRASVPAQPLLHLRAGDRVERAERLVQAQHRLAREQRAQERHALAHAAGQLVGVRALEALEPELGEQRAARGARAARAPQAGDAQRERGVVERAQPRQQQVALGHQHGRQRSSTDPPSGRCRPQTSSSSVVLPQPLGPTTATTSPAPARSETLGERLDAAPRAPA